MNDVKREYLIRKRGAYYRPNSQGYTTSAIQAGRYTLEEARDISHPNGPKGPRDGMDYIHESEIRCEDWRDYIALRARLADLEAAIDTSENDGNMWRFWSDKSRKLATKNSALEAALATAKRDALDLGGVDEGDGFWKSCSGCHETNEGYETGHYPYSQALKCYRGAGCSECGGLGAVWDNTDYADMGRALADEASS